MNNYVMSENLEAAQSGLGLEGKTKQWEKRLESHTGPDGNAASYLLLLFISILYWEVLGVWFLAMLCSCQV